LITQFGHSGTIPLGKALILIITRCVGFSLEPTDFVHYLFLLLPNRNVAKAFHAYEGFLGLISLVNCFQNIHFIGYYYFWWNIVRLKNWWNVNK